MFSSPRPHLLFLYHHCWKGQNELGRKFHLDNLRIIYKIQISSNYEGWKLAGRWNIENWGLASGNKAGQMERSRHCKQFLQYRVVSNIQRFTSSTRWIYLGLINSIVTLVILMLFSLYSNVSRFLCVVKFLSSCKLLWINKLLPHETLIDLSTNQ